MSTRDPEAPEMTPNQKLAVDALKAATGWDAEPFTNVGAKAQRPNGTSLCLWRSQAGKWKCAVDPANSLLSWQGEGATPEAAIADVLPRYRAKIAELAVDILPPEPAPVAPQVIRLHQSLQGTSCCYHCGLPMPWLEMDPCPRKAPEPLLKWREDGGASTGSVLVARRGCFTGVVRSDGWRLEFSAPGSIICDVVDRGPEVGPEGQGKAEAAYLRACGGVS